MMFPEFQLWSHTYCELKTASLLLHSGLLFGNQLGTAGCLSLFCTASDLLLVFKEGTTGSSLIHL